MPFIRFSDSDQGRTEREASRLKQRSLFSFVQAADGLTVPEVGVTSADFDHLWRQFLRGKDEAALAEIAGEYCLEKRQEAVVFKFAPALGFIALQNVLSASRFCIKY